MTRDSSQDNMRGRFASTLKRDNSVASMASQGAERRMSVGKAGGTSSAMRNQAHAAFTHLNFLGTDKVDTKRVKMERFNNALEA